jgi:hypothetical protein
MRVRKRAVRDRLNDTYSVTPAPVAALRPRNGATAPDQCGGHHALARIAATPPENNCDVSTEIDRTSYDVRIGNRYDVSLAINKYGSPKPRSKGVLRAVRIVVEMKRAVA